MACMRVDAEEVLLRAGRPLRYWYMNIAQVIEKLQDEDLGRSPESSHLQIIQHYTEQLDKAIDAFNELISPYYSDGTIAPTADEEECKLAFDMVVYQIKRW